MALDRYVLAVAPLVCAAAVVAAFSARFHRAVDSAAPLVSTGGLPVFGIGCVPRLACRRFRRAAGSGVPFVAAFFARLHRAGRGGFLRSPPCNFDFLRSPRRRFRRAVRGGLRRRRTARLRRAAPFVAAFFTRRHRRIAGFRRLFRRSSPPCWSRRFSLLAAPVIPPHRSSPRRACRVGFLRSSPPADCRFSPQVPPQVPACCSWRSSPLAAPQVPPRRLWRWRRSIRKVFRERQNRRLTVFCIGCVPRLSCRPSSSRFHRRIAGLRRSSLSPCNFDFRHAGRVGFLRLSHRSSPPRR